MGVFKGSYCQDNHSLPLSWQTRKYVSWVLDVAATRPRIWCLKRIVRVLIDCSINYNHYSKNNNALGTLCSPQCYLHFSFALYKISKYSDLIILNKNVGPLSAYQGPPCFLQHGSACQLLARDCISATPLMQS